MKVSSFHFKVGKYECIAVSDGSIPSADAAQLLFKNAPKELLAQAMRTNNIHLDQWIELFTCLMIQTRGHNVLVDTGLGDLDWAPNAGKLLQNLSAEGFEPGDIDTVIISHAHGDHIGGNTNAEGRANFPNAQYYMRKEEWDFWTSEATLANPAHEWMGEFVNKRLLPIRDHLKLLEQDVQIVPGIKTLFSPGHTPGHMAVVIESNGDKLINLGDAILHPLHLEHPGWYSEPDCEPAQTVSTRRSILRRAANDQALVFAFHFDFPCLGHVLPQQKNWKWQPIDIPG